MTIVETCKGCKYKRRCNGRVSKNSSYCDNLRSESIKKKGKTIGQFFTANRGFDKTSILLKFLQSKDNNEKDSK